MHLNMCTDEAHLVSDLGKRHKGEMNLIKWASDASPRDGIIAKNSNCRGQT